MKFLHVYMHCIAFTRSVGVIQIGVVDGNNGGKVISVNSLPVNVTIVAFEHVVVVVAIESN